MTHIDELNRDAVQHRPGGGDITRDRRSFLPRERRSLFDQRGLVHGQHGGWSNVGDGTTWLLGEHIEADMLGGDVQLPFDVRGDPGDGAEHDKSYGFVSQCAAQSRDVKEFLNDQAIRLALLTAELAVVGVAETHMSPRFHSTVQLARGFLCRLDGAARRSRGTSLVNLTWKGLRESNRRQNGGSHQGGGRRREAH